MTPKERHGHFAKVAALGCCVCRKNGLGASPACVHHLTGIKYRAMGKKAADEHVIPLCHYHHQGYAGIHKCGMRAWEAVFGTQESYLEWTKQQLA